ncbi:TPA: hypothetical protein ACGUM0_004545, partial [Vibrio vulnificus]
ISIFGIFNLVLHRLRGKYILKLSNKPFFLEVVSIFVAVFCVVYMLYVERYFSGPVTVSDVEYYHVIYFEDVDEGKGPIRNKLKTKDNGKSIVVDYYPFNLFSDEQRNDIKVGVVNHLGGDNIYYLVSLDVLGVQIIDPKISIFELNEKNKTQQEEIIYLFITALTIIIFVRLIKLNLNV